MNSQLKNFWIVFGLLLIFVTPSVAEMSYETLWTGLLQTHTKEEKKSNISARLVDYSGFQKSQTFRTILRYFSHFDLEMLKEKNDRLAFWINVYNIAAIKMVVDFYPVDSIKNIGSILAPVWKRPAINVGGTTYSLNQIEHEILRKQGDPRIHFAIVCASLSCPDLLNVAYTSDQIDKQLDNQVSQFLKDSDKGLKINKSAKEIEVSKIFQWFEEDFEAGIVSFIASYSTLLNEDTAAYSLHYLPYSWSLNNAN